MADSMNPFVAMTTSAPGVAVTTGETAAPSVNGGGGAGGNPFDVFAVGVAAPNGGGESNQASTASRTISPTPSTMSNPFAAMGSSPAQTPQFENLQISEKPAVMGQQQQQQPWQQPPMSNGHQTAVAQPQQPQVPMQQPAQQEQVPVLQQKQSFQQEAPAAAPPPQQNPFAFLQAPNQPVGAILAVENPWTANQQQQQQQQPSTQPDPTPFNAYPVAPQQAPYAQANAAANPFAAYSSAMVPSQQASNPYAGLVVPQQQQQQQQQQQPPQVHQYAMVPAVQQSNQWSMGASQAVAPVAATYDPFAPAPVSVPQPPPPVYSSAAVPVAQSEALYGSNSYASANAVGYPAPSQALVPAPAGPYPGAPVPVATPAPNDASSYAKPPPVASVEVQSAPPQFKSDQSRSDGSHQSGDRSSGGDEHRQMVPYKPDGHTIEVPNDRQLAVVPDDDVEKPKRNIFSETLAKNAPPGSAPLPKANQIVKSGFVLARISMRTIVMKSWKQAYWVQYGPHTMLWFRSQADFDDWLNNPYHTPAQRNFLIKLAVNFVHDLYKPNVRGYQVTQSRTKTYGREQIKQFKLERWMDYGPTIAAAFGSQDPREVDNLRQALVECMRNTPLEGGLRATGAVRQDYDEARDKASDDDEMEHDHNQSFSYDSERMAGASYDDDEQQDRSRDRDNRDNRSDDRKPNNAPPSDQEQSKEPAASPPPPAGDLLDDSFFDVPLHPPQVPQQQPPPFQGHAGAAVAGAPPNYGAPPQNYAQATPPQAPGQPPQPFPPPPPPQGYPLQPPPANHQQQAPVYAQPNPQQHYYGFPPVPPQYQQQPQQPSR